MNSSLPPPATAPERRTYTVREVAQVTGLSETAIYRMVRAGEFPVPSIGTRRSIRFPIARILEWVDGQEKAS